VHIKLVEPIIFIKCWGEQIGNCVRLAGRCKAQIYLTIGNFSSNERFRYYVRLGQKLHLMIYVLLCKLAKLCRLGVGKPQMDGECHV